MLTWGGGGGGGGGGGEGVGGQEPRNLNWSPLYPETLNSLSNRDGDDNENVKKHKII